MRANYRITEVASTENAPVYFSKVGRQITVGDLVGGIGQQDVARHIWQEARDGATIIINPIGKGWS